MRHRREVLVGGRPLIIETGGMARQADGAVTVRYGDTVVLVTACAASPREGLGFLPLTVDYRENTYAAGKIPGGFFRREGRPNEKEILTSRMIDRPLRPLFPAGWNCETQVIGLLLSSDQQNDSDVLAITGASFALNLSSIPFTTPIAAVRVGLTPEGEYRINPTFQELETSRLDLVVAASETAVVMVEAGAQGVSEQEMLEGIYRGFEAIQPILALQREMLETLGKPKRPLTVQPEPEGLRDALRSAWKAPLAEAMRIPGKLASYAQVDRLKEEMLATFAEDDAAGRAFASRAWNELQEEVLREEVLDRGRRLDGRRFEEIREIHCEVGVLPRTHGSALFTRGETQALVTVTLGTAADAQRLDWVEGESFKRFMLHYNFPPFSVGEVRFLRGPGRREIGHGALAERSLLPVVPREQDWPYTIRIVSDILESNGSSSMASICGGSLALMDAGVPLQEAVAGIAMGLVTDGSRAAVLTDIAGAEDHYGDMDFKVAGTRVGLTGLQMDIKVSGITREVMQRALAQARAARLEILEHMRRAIERPRPSISPYAPRIVTLTVNKDKIRDIIGPGGRTIRSIVERTGCKIDVHDDGRVEIASSDEAAARQAVEIIKELTAEAELGKTYLGRVARVVNFGAFVEILPGVEGLLHVSEVTNHRIPDVFTVLHEGDEVLVKVVDIDALGRVRLSRRALLQEGPVEDAVSASGGDLAPRSPSSGGHPRREEPVGAGSAGGANRTGRRHRPRRRGSSGGERH